jgi:hypothetical protein
MKKINEHSIDFQKVSEGCGLPLEDVISFFDDGRIIGRFAEFIQKHKYNTQRTNENSPYDVDGDNKRIEVRCITKQLSFASSKEIGFGRKVTEEGFKEKLNNIDVYHVVDKRNINNLKIIEVTKENVEEMINLKLIGKNKTITSKNFFNYYDRNK